MRTANIPDTTPYRVKKPFNPLFALLMNAMDKLLLELDLPDEGFDKLFVKKRILKDHHSGEIFEAAGPKASGDSFPSGYVYLIQGKKGSGKTVTLNRFMQDVQKTLVERNEKTYIFYLNLLSKTTDKPFKKRLLTTDGEEDINNSLIHELYDKIKQNAELKTYLEEPEKIKQLDGAYQYLPDSILVQRMLDNKSEAVRKLLKYLSDKSSFIYLIIDNIDDFSLEHIRGLINTCTELRDAHKLKCIVALRDYWNRRTLEISDRQLLFLDIGFPDVTAIAKRRLDSLPIDSLVKYDVRYKNFTISLSQEEMVGVLKQIIDYIAASNAEISNNLVALGNYNVREHLSNIYYFFHSPYLLTQPFFVQALAEKIKEIDPDYTGEKRKPRFFDFLECVMGVHTLCYDTGSSNIFNIFFHDEKNLEGGYDYRNTFVYMRVLQSVENSEKKEKVINTLKGIGYDEASLKRAINILFDKALIESVQGNEVEYAEDIMLSAKGRLYLKTLILEFTYLYFICDFVPIPERYKIGGEEKFGLPPEEGHSLGPGKTGKLESKFTSVYKFLEFLIDEEQDEETRCSARYLPSLKRIKGYLINDGDSGTVNHIRENVQQIENNMRGSNRPPYRTPLANIIIEARQENVT